MGDSIDITVEGAEEIARAMLVAPKVAGPLVERGVHQSLLVVEGKVAPYPPEPDRMRSGTFNSYLRGVGHMPKSYFFGGGSEGPRGGKPLFNSEDLGQKWGIETRRTPTGYLGILGNPVSYADVVQGTEQAPYHIETGWVGIVQAAKESAKAIQAIFNGVMVAIAKRLERLMQS